MAAKDTPAPQLDTSDPKLWVLTFSPESTGRISKSGMNETILNHRTVVGDVVMNFQAYRPKRRSVEKHTARTAFTEEAAAAIDPHRANIRPAPASPLTSARQNAA